jgi:hypothetical protein
MPLSAIGKADTELFDIKLHLRELLREVSAGYV